MTRGLEATIEEYLRKQCVKRGWDCDKYELKTGDPDRIILTTKGVVAFVEVKAGREAYISPAQKRRIKQLIKKEFITCIVRNFREVNTLIRDIQNEIDRRKQ